MNHVETGLVPISEVETEIDPFKDHESGKGEEKARYTSRHALSIGIATECVRPRSSGDLSHHA
ncbi:hypothetical protein Misp02_02760 [Microtetraspora sp. NBRC 16547]|nr:hypothetical protein Misp02_02760 [Microtetraspora sp. NBRC 16547]